MTKELIARPKAEWNNRRPLVEPDELTDGVILFPPIQEETWQERVRKLPALDGEIKVTDFFKIVNGLSKSAQERELLKCRVSPEYFIDNFCWIRHPKRGLVRFRMFDYQRFKVLPAFFSQQYFITRKFRQGGFSTLAGGYALWTALFEADREILVVSKSDREAKNWMSIVQNMWANLPDWLKCRELAKNKSQLYLETGSRISAYTPKAGRSFAISVLIIDEAAFIEGMEDLWADIFPTVSTGGQVIIVSTVKGVGNWYHKTWVGAERRENDFTPVFIKHTEHPDYQDPTWENKMRRQLGERRFRQEVLAEFMGSAETYIPYEKLKVITERVESDPAPIRVQDVPVGHEGALLEGAFKIWSEPEPGKEYAIGVDVAIGAGQNADCSAICVLETMSLEQVAEFSSNEIAPAELAKVAAMIGIFYNVASVGVEANSIGSSVLQTLINELYYENVYFQSPGKAGLTMTSQNRPVILSTLNQALVNDVLRVRSPRLANELATWIWNPRTKRVEHMSGYHDDHVMALAIALVVREEALRNAPIMVGGGGESSGALVGDDEDFGWGSAFSEPAPQNNQKKLSEPASVFTFSNDEQRALMKAVVGSDAPAPSNEEPLMPTRSRGGLDSDSSDFLKEFGW